MLATVVILFLAKFFKMVSFPDVGRDTLRKIWPLPLMFVYISFFPIPVCFDVIIPGTWVIWFLGWEALKNSHCQWWLFWEGSLFLMLFDTISNFTKSELYLDNTYPHAGFQYSWLWLESSTSWRSPLFIPSCREETSHSFNADSADYGSPVVCLSNDLRLRSRSF